MMQAWKTAELVKNGDISAKENILRYIDIIKKKDEDFNAFITLNNGQAVNRAKQIDEMVSEGIDPGKLAGVPVVIKDNISTKGMRTTCGSKMLKDYKPVFNAHVVKRIIEEGGIVIGKSNCDEFAMGSSNETSYFGVVNNPEKPNFVPGGSSGGSAAAVAYGASPVALGSDTGGSIRCPAAFCGLVGLKPTYGAVSRYGLISHASSLDQIGPITNKVKDAALMFDVISGKDDKDQTSIEYTSNSLENIKSDISNITLGVAAEFFGKGIDNRVENKVKNSISLLEDLGSNIEKVKIPTAEYSLPAYYVISTGEASSNLARFDGIRYGYSEEINKNWKSVFSENRGNSFGDEVIRRIILGTFALSAGFYGKYYKKAMEVRSKLIDEFNQAFNKVDAIILPTMPYPPFKIGEKKDDPLALYKSDMLTVPMSLAGLPSISIPCDKNSLIGMQITGKMKEEEKILNIALAHEEAL